MNKELRRVEFLFGKAMAERVDEDIIYGLDEKAIKWFNRQFRIKLDTMRPKWFPLKVWVWLHKEVKDDKDVYF